ncbi:hypothetical protein NDN08_004842 [Rhodosorus marinus]|uniref:Uncharacterized protein n=1 Tax=Rhodosorus marinus TaxID=101924 RepID=A0AAV8URK5_9RHOD|nr:hypothetical protein NDN08_004842 [Rhodosorus marinus]
MSQKRVLSHVNHEELHRLSVVSGSIRNGKHSPPGPEIVLTIGSVAPDFNFELLISTCTLVEDYVMCCLNDSRGQEARSEPTNV